MYSIVIIKLTQMVLNLNQRKLDCFVYQCECASLCCVPPHYGGLSEMVVKSVKVIYGENVHCFLKKIKSVSTAPFPFLIHFSKSRNSHQERKPLLHTKTKNKSKFQLEKTIVCILNLSKTKTSSCWFYIIVVPSSV